MPSEVPLTLYEGNDETLHVTITSNIAGFTLVGKTIETFLKANRATVDGDAGVWKGSTSTGEVVIVDADEATVAVPASVVTTTKGWWRCDVIDGTGKRKTAGYGPVTIVDL